MRVRIATACLPDETGDHARNLDRAIEMTRALTLEGAELIVLPEACVQGYPAGEQRFDRSRILEWAEPMDGEWIGAYRDLADLYGVHLVVGYDRIDGDRLYNTAELIGPNGETIGRYDKTHVQTGGDVGLYDPGDDLPVFETSFGRVGLLICNDRVYAESWRVLMLRGADLVLIPSNGSYNEMNTLRLRVMAMDNGVATAFAHPKRGFIVAPDGSLLDHDGEGARPYAIADLDLSSTARRREEIRRRRRVDLYGDLTASA